MARRHGRSIKRTAIAEDRPFLSELKALTGGKGGRFLASVLKEVGRQEPALLQKIFARRGRPLRLEPDDQVVTEYPYLPGRPR